MILKFSALSICILCVAPRNLCTTSRYVHCLFELCITPQIMCTAELLCVVFANFMLLSQILCTLFKFCDVWNHVHCLFKLCFFVSNSCQCLKILFKNLISKTVLNLSVCADLYVSAMQFRLSLKSAQRCANLPGLVLSHSLTQSYSSHPSFTMSSRMPSWLHHSSDTTPKFAQL